MLAAEVRCTALRLEAGFFVEPPPTVRRTCGRASARLSHGPLGLLFNAGGRLVLVRPGVEHQTKDLVLSTQRGQSTDLLPDAQSGDGGVKLRPHCDQATRDERGQMSDSDPQQRG
jgi:hypothetical protein